MHPASHPFATLPTFLQTLGYYQLQAAANDAGVRDALVLMQLAAPQMPQPELGLGIAQAQWRLGQAARARAGAEAVLEKHPDLKQARELLARLSR